MALVDRIHGGREILVARQQYRDVISVDGGEMNHVCDQSRIN